MRFPRHRAALAAALLPLCALAASPIDGTWKGSFTAPGAAGAMALTFTFKAEGERVTGSVGGGSGPAPITSGSIKGDALEFKVDLGGTTIEHQGRLAGDTIDLTFSIGSQPPAHLRLARVAERSDPSGSWRWTVSPAGTDQVFPVSAQLSFLDGRLSGIYRSGMGAAPISDASFDGSRVAFSVERVRDGKKFVVRYEGTLAGDSIAGTLVLPGFEGAPGVSVEWKALRAR